MSLLIRIQIVSFFQFKAVLEPGNRYDPYCTSLVTKNTEIVGHIPREISRYIHFFLKRGGQVSATVTSTRRHRSPIEQGGLEVLITVTARHDTVSATTKLLALTLKHVQEYEALHNEAVMTEQPPNPTPRSLTSKPTKPKNVTKQVVSLLSDSESEDDINISHSTVTTTRKRVRVRVESESDSD